MANTTLVIIPTYNEVENLPLIVNRVLSATPQVDILVVDDNSPDGTGSVADQFASEHEIIHVIHRQNKEGLLAAYREGFRWALGKNYQIICQMDADGSHAPEELELFLSEIDNGADVVIGSRYIDGGEVKNWPEDRYFLSKVGNKYISLALGDDVSDMTSGYRTFRRNVLEQIDLNDLSEKGYIFQVDLAHKAIRAGFDVREVPITFEDRKLGESKLDASFAAQSLIEVTRWGAKDKSTFVQEGFKEFRRLAENGLDRSALLQLKRTVEEAPEEAVNLLEEGARLAGHQFDRSGIKQIPRKAARGVDTAVDLVREGLTLAEYQLRHSRFAKIMPRLRLTAAQAKDLAEESTRLASHEREQFAARGLG